MQNPEIRELVGHSSGIRQTAEKRQKSFFKQNPPPCSEALKTKQDASWPHAKPEEYYQAEEGRIVIQGCQFAEGILPSNVQEAASPYSPTFGEEQIAQIRANYFFLTPRITKTFQLLLALFHQKNNFPSHR